MLSVITFAAYSCGEACQILTLKKGKSSEMLSPSEIFVGQSHRLDFLGSCSVLKYICYNVITFKINFICVPSSQTFLLLLSFYLKLKEPCVISKFYYLALS